MHRRPAADVPVPRRWCLAAVLLALVSAATAETAQAPSGGLRLQGVVTAPDDSTVDGASVSLHQRDRETGFRPTTRTSADGRWAVVVPAPGRWEIEIEAEGFLPTEGWVQVLSGRPTPLVEVELRALEEGTPAFLEGNRATITRWLERGNALLEQGRTAAARAEYEKALPVLPEAERPDVLQAIARTHFMERSYDDAVATLEAALAIAPGDRRLRQIYRLLMEEIGRGDAVEGRLGEIAAARRPREQPAATRSPRGPAIERPPIDELASAGRKGHYRTRFTRTSPLSTMETYLDRFGYTAEEIRPYDNAMGRYRLAEESFDVFVPDDWDGEEPLGLLVFVSPTPFGGFTKDEIATVLAARRLIWVGPDNVGNGRSAWYRIHLALDAAHNLAELYPIDTDRVYVSGYSGGGRVASAMTFLYPEVFSGGFFFYGTDWHEPLNVPYQPGATWPAKFPRPDKRRFTQVRESSRLVFLTGERDFNRAQTKAAWRRAVATGFSHVTYLEIPEADHYFGIDGEWLDRGLAALDAPLAEGR